MDPRIDGFDWEQAFEYANRPEAVPPGSSVSTDGFTQNDVAQVIAASEGENDGDHWLALVWLKDGRCAFLTAGCDYTGWDCRADGRSWVSASLESMLALGIDAESQERLDLKNALKDLRELRQLGASINVGYRLGFMAGGGIEAKAYVAAPDAAELERGFDCARSIMLLRAAADALENGDGITATRNAAEAWARICIAHKG